MQGHLTQDYRTKVMRTSRFDGHYYNYKKYGHKAFECRSKPMWTPNQLARRNNYAHCYNWDYNTGKICHYYQEYGHVPQNYIRTHFKKNYRRWLSQITCFSWLKIWHVRKYCPTKAKETKPEVNKGKEKVDVEHIRAEMKRTWQRRNGSNTFDKGVTSPKRSSDHTSSN